MAQIIRMPLKTDTMEEGVITTLFVKAGDTIESGDLYAEIETDKATMEWDSFEDGTILHVGVEEGDTVPVNDPVFILGEEGEDISDLLKEFEGGSNSAESKSDETQEKEGKQEEAPQKEEKQATEKAESKDFGSMVAVRMRKMTDTMEEGVLASWLVSEGEEVEENQPIAEVETDKATMDFETYEAGKVLHLAVEEGDTVPIDDIIAVLGEEGDDYKAFLAHEKSGASSSGTSDSSKASAQPEPASSPSDEATTSSEGTPAPKDEDDKRIKASPLARKMAEDKGYKLSQISGTGDNGRIIKRDIESYTPQKEEPKKTEEKAPSEKKEGTPQPSFAGVQEGTRTEKVSQMRKAIARSLTDSKFSAPHFYLTLPIRMDKAIQTRKRLNEISPVKISFNDLVVKAAALALRQHPYVNAGWKDNELHFHDHVHMGVAVAVDEGLLVPAIRHADAKSLSQISGETKELAQKARDRKLQPEDWENTTFTISNLGMFGIEEFTAIINPPNSCIMAVGAIRKEAVVDEETNELSVGSIMRVTLSCDHRVVDGAVGAAFLQTFQQLLEDPLRMLV